MSHLWALVWGLGGTLGVVGLIALAIFGGPFASVIAKLGEAVLTPIASAAGAIGGTLLKSEADGGRDMLATGQRILFVLTCCAVTYWGAQHYLMKWVHTHYWLGEKHYAVIKPRGHR